MSTTHIIQLKKTVVNTFLRRFPAEFLPDFRRGLPESANIEFDIAPPGVVEFPIV